MSASLNKLFIFTLSVPYVYMRISRYIKTNIHYDKRHQKCSIHKSNAKEKSNFHLTLSKPFSLQPIISEQKQSSMNSIERMCSILIQQQVDNFNLFFAENLANHPIKFLDRAGSIG